MNPDYFLSRSSCRNFSSSPITDSQLDNILIKASKAPTCGNMQLYSVIVTREEDNKKRLSGFHYNQPASTSAPIILTVCADFNRFVKWCEINEANSGHDNFHSFINALTDAVIFTQQIVTIAETEGLGTCYLGTVTYNAKEISDLLKLPKLVVPVASIAIGYPACEGEKTDRLPLKAVLHHEVYQQPTYDEIKKYYSIHDDNPDNAKFIEETGKNNLAQVFAEVRYPKEMNEKISENFIEILKEKGFIK